ncbi:MAG: large conductance mechanosensitive channel protein MscL [Microbacterium sp.]|uniref:large conductance mechanosensitive channel protein MscL n=1 Tax=Microbacterium sp. TaxID=51671 RepID=UPI0039E376FE
MSEKKGLIAGFKEFIAGGNVIDLAVAVVIGTAFTTIVTAAVENIINPLLGLFLPSGSLSGWVISVPAVFGTAATFGIGALIQAIINFLAIALVVYFFIVRPFAAMKARADAKKAPAEEEPAGPTQEELLVQIRDLLARNGA